MFSILVETQNFITNSVNRNQEKSLKTNEPIEVEFAMVVDVKSTTSTIIASMSRPNSLSNNPTKLSIYTLTTILGCIYGLAFILAISWIIWLWVRKKPLNGRADYSSSRCC